jgi:hypothetical protein
MQVTAHALAAILRIITPEDGHALQQNGRAVEVAPENRVGDYFRTSPKDSEGRIWQTYDGAEIITARR